MYNDEKPLSPDDFSVADLFCGVGGLTHGFILEGFKVDAGIDSDNTCEYAYETNNNTEFYHRDITQLSATELYKYYTKRRKILVGCAPCQPFSLYSHSGNSKNNSRAEGSTNDSKWKLLYSFSNLIKDVDPEIVSMENVPQLINFNSGRVYQDFVIFLEKLGYKVSAFIVNAQDYGVPQRRKRLILFASKYGRITLIDKTITNNQYLTVRQTIGHLPPVEDGIAHPDDPLHRARKLSVLNKRRIKATKEGGFWRDWDEELILNCHKKNSGKEFSSVYGRMKWNDVSPTITTCCIGLNNGRFGHPEQDRAITLREAALLQSFPDDYKFLAPNQKLNSEIVARQIGNAVPVNLAVVIARSIKNHIKEIANDT